MRINSRGEAMTGFLLRVIAMLTMFVDHLGFGFVETAAWMRVVGRCAFILYAFLIAESYYHLQNKPDRLRSHVIKLMVLAVVSEVPYDLFCEKTFFDWNNQNVVFTLLLGFAALIACECWNKRFSDHLFSAAAGDVVICLLAAGISHLIRSDYGFYGVLLIVMFYLYRRRVDEKSNARKFIELLLLYAGYIAVYLCFKAGFGGRADFAKAARLYRYWFAGMLIPFIIIFFCNQKRGFNSKWFGILYSWFYPVHMIVLFLIRRFLIR